MEQEISIRELLAVFRKYTRLIIAVTVALVIASAVISYGIIDKEYTTYTTLMIGRPQDYAGETDSLYNEIRLNQQLVPTYSELVKTRAVADKVIEEMDLPISYSAFRDKVGVSLVNNTELIKIQITDTDPEMAANIANHTAAVFTETVVDVMNIENVQVIDEAQVPTRPIRPRPLQNIAIAGVLGFMTAVVAVFLREFLDNTIKTQEDVSRYLEVPVLGMIPKDD